MMLLLYAVRKLDVVRGEGLCLLTVRKIITVFDSLKASSPQRLYCLVGSTIIGQWRRGGIDSRKKVRKQLRGTEMHVTFA